MRLLWSKRENILYFDRVENWKNLRRKYIITIGDMTEHTRCWWQKRIQLTQIFGKKINEKCKNNSSDQKMYQMTLLVRNFRYWAAWNCLNSTRKTNKEQHRLDILIGIITWGMYYKKILTANRVGFRRPTTGNIQTKTEKRR